MYFVVKLGRSKFRVTVWG